MGLDIDAVLPKATRVVFGDGERIEGVKMRRLNALIAFREDLTPADRDRLKVEGLGLGGGQDIPIFLACTCGLPRTRLSFAHEMVHGVQGNLTAGWRQRLPTWLIEGTAEHLSRVMAAERGLEKCSPSRCNGADPLAFIWRRP